DINRTSGRSLYTKIHVEYIHDKIINAIIRPCEDLEVAPGIMLSEGGRITAPENMDGAYAARLHNSYGLPVKKWKMNLNFNSRLYYNHNFTIVNAQKVEDISYGLAQSFGVNSNISKQYVLGLHYHLTGAYYENIL